MIKKLEKILIFSIFFDIIIMIEERRRVMEKEDKRGIFFGVIGVLTLIVAIIGASFAYFSINAKSDKDAVKVKAASVQIVYVMEKKLLLRT